MRIRSFSCWALMSVLAPLMQGQATLAEVTGQTPPEKVSALLWDTILTKCGRSYYLTSASPDYFDHYYPGGTPKEKVVLVEYRDVSGPRLQVLPLSPVDRANGFEFRGLTELTATMSRERYSKNNSWSEWTDPNPLKMLLVRKNGRWSIGDGYLVRNRDATSELDQTQYTKYKMSCATASSANPFADFQSRTAGPSRRDDTEIFRNRYGLPSITDSHFTLSKKALLYDDQKLYNYLQSLSTLGEKGCAGPRVPADLQALDIDAPGTKVLFDRLGACYTYVTDATKAELRNRVRALIELGVSRDRAPAEPDPPQPITGKAPR